VFAELCDNPLVTTTSAAPKYLQPALELHAHGRYREALTLLDDGASTLYNTVDAQILRAALLEIVGFLPQAQMLAEGLLQKPRLTANQRAHCENTIGRVLIERGLTDEGTKHLQRAVVLSQKSGDLKQVCWIQTKLLAVISDRSGPDAAAPLLSELRRSTTKLGDPHTTAQLHLYVAEMEARKGLLDTAIRHVILSQQLIDDAQNLWLESMAENILLAISVLRPRLDEGQHHSTRALQIAEDSGHAACRRSAAANTGNLLLVRGEFDKAIEYFKMALNVSSAKGPRASGILDSVALARLAQGELAECENVLRELDATIRSDADRSFYGYRHAEHTRSRLFYRQGRLTDALSAVTTTIRLSRQTGDQMLLQSALLTQAEVQQALGQDRECAESIHHVLTTGQMSTESIARFELIVARSCQASNQERRAVSHFERARRICQLSGDIKSLRHIEDGFTRHRLTSDDSHRDAIHQSRQVLHSLSTTLLHALRPEVVAAELRELMSAVECCLTVQNDTQTDRNARESTHKNQRELRRVLVANGDSGATTLHVQPVDGIDSEAALGLIGALVDKLHEYEQWRSERERRSNLWKAEESSDVKGRAVISGHMQELLDFAQRVARTTVNVLITGESGTGKEILARAIHDFSDRSQKAFVPLNCAAVPRDLLESQLFGHRRGSFTGAERDQLGVIRSADGGTIFLDEVGEMSSDLQPKLLRFLESGEIAPLGEPAPMTVNVRVVAATNSNLDEAVRSGRFREDLFYRLNVVRLVVRPLRERRDEIPGLATYFVARAAAEYGKGHLEISEDAMERLLLYRWPGNIRQLQNEIHRIVALAEPASTIQADAISPDILGALPDLRRPLCNGKEITVPVHEKLAPTLARIEYEMIKTALRHHHGRMEPAAKALGISRKGLYLKRQRLGL